MDSTDEFPLSTEREASLPDALADRTKVMKLVVDKWFVDKGFGFGKVPQAKSFSSTPALSEVPKSS